VRNTRCRLPSRRDLTLNLSISKELLMLNIRIALLTVAATLALAVTGPASAQAAPEKALASGGPDTTTAAELSDGEIRKIDKDNKKLTIKHGPLKNLDMPGMTMVFAVNDEAMLDQVQPGEKVLFQAEKMSGKIVVMKIQAAGQ